MKQFAATVAVISVIGGAALAGGMAEPIMEEEIVAEEATSSSNAGILVPILALILFAFAFSNNGGSDSGDVVIEGGA
jgi:hypothetical protein